MRKLVLVIAAMLASSAAAADQTVSYRGGDGRDLVLEISDAGSVRITGPEKGQGAVIERGVLYLVGEEKGEPRVVRLTDLVAVMEEAVGPFFKALFEKVGEQAAASDLVITPKGDGSFGGFNGKAYSIKGLDDSNPDAAIDWIASSDPALAPAGTALKQFIDLTLVMASPFLGKAVDAMLAENRQLFALGTPLDAGGKLQLASVRQGPIDSVQFKLPTEPISREALKAEMQARSAAPAQ